MDTVKTIYLESHPSRALIPGQVRYIAISAKAPAGKPISELPKVEVTLTLDAGPEDLDVERRHGRQTLRGIKTLRLTEETLDQGGVLSEEDLSRILGVDERTIRRDIASLRGEGYLVKTRGYLHDIGKGSSHKTRIVELWLKRFTYSEIARITRHSPMAIQRYIISFGRVVLLRKRGFQPRETAFLCGLSVRLVREYLGLVQDLSEEYGDRIAEIVDLLGKSPSSEGKKGVT